MSNVGAYTFLSAIGCLLLVDSSQQQFAKWEACDRLCGQLQLNEPIMDSSESSSEEIINYPSWSGPFVRQLELIFQSTESYSSQLSEYHPKFRKVVWFWPELVRPYPEWKPYPNFSPSLPLARIPFIPRSERHVQRRKFRKKRRVPASGATLRHLFPPIPDQNPFIFQESDQISEKQMERSKGFSSKESSKGTRAQSITGTTISNPGKKTARRTPPRIKFG